jgi:putative mRNA 3-end processing factor
MSHSCMVLPGGPIILGKTVCCDGFSLRPVRVISHVHDDHIRDFETSLGVQDAIVMLPATRDLLYAIKGKSSLQLRNNLLPLPAGQASEFFDTKITLIAANHMLGSAQVFVEYADGTRLGYTGDFGWPTDVLKVDELVIDATYGSPDYRREYNEEQVVDDLVSLVEKLIRNGRRRVCIKAFTGRLQFVMQQLQERIRVPFIAGKKQAAIADVYRQHGVLVVDVISALSDAGKAILKGTEAYIEFHHLHEKIPETQYDVVVYVSSFMMPREQPIVQWGNNHYQAALTDHADFDQTIEYVRQAQPKLVIVDNSRAGDADALAEEIRARLSIKAIVGG